MRLLIIMRFTVDDGNKIIYKPSSIICVVVAD